MRPIPVSLLKPSELLMMFLRRWDIEFKVRGSSGAAGPKVDRFSVPIDPRSVCSIMKVNTFIARSIVFPLWSVSFVLAARANTQIRTPIVKALSVPMISLSWIAMLESQNLAVHRFVFSVIALSCVVILFLFVPHRLPFGKHEPVIVGCVNDSHLTKGQRNFTVGLFRGCLHFALPKAWNGSGLQALMPSVYQEVAQ